MYYTLQVVTLVAQQNILQNTENAFVTECVSSKNVHAMDAMLLIILLLGQHEGGRSEQHRREYCRQRWDKGSLPCLS